MTCACTHTQTHIHTHNVPFSWGTRKNAQDGTRHDIPTRILKPAAKPEQCQVVQAQFRPNLLSLFDVPDSLPGENLCPALWSGQPCFPSVSTGHSVLCCSDYLGLQRSVPSTKPSPRGKCISFQSLSLSFFLRPKGQQHLEISWVGQD